MPILLADRLLVSIAVAASSFPSDGPPGASTAPYPPPFNLERAIMLQISDSYGAGWYP